MRKKNNLYIRPPLPDTNLVCDVCQQKPAKFVPVQMGRLETKGMVLCQECCDKLFPEKKFFYDRY